MRAAADYEWGTVVVGADLDAVRFAHDNKCILIKNRKPHYHSYQQEASIWAEKAYDLYQRGLCPFFSNVKKIRVFTDNYQLKVITSKGSHVIKFDKLHVYDDENVEGFSLDRELAYYRVIDWFDCKGMHSLEIQDVVTQDEFVNKIIFFKSTRFDGNQKYLDLLCESFLTKEQLKKFDYSDTMAKFKVANELSKKGLGDIAMSVWKRDVYPVYK